MLCVLNYAIPARDVIPSDRSKRKEYFHGTKNLILYLVYYTRLPLR